MINWIKWITVKELTRVDIVEWPNYLCMTESGLFFSHCMMARKLGKCTSNLAKFFFNSLAPGKFEWNFRHVIFKKASLVKLPRYKCHWTFTDDQSALVQVLAWCWILYHDICVTHGVFRKCRRHEPLAHCARQWLIYIAKFMMNLEEMVHYECEIYHKSWVF